MFSFVQPVDDFVLQALVPARSPALTELMRAVGTLGEWYILLPVAAAIVYVLARMGLASQARELSYAVIGTSVAVVILKMLVARPRPPEALRLIAESGYSWPSWHASIAVAFWGYLAYLAVHYERGGAKGRRELAVLAAALAIIIGFSRIYLGVHYLSDVIGGFAIGGLLLWLAIRFTRWSQQGAA